MGDQIVAEPLHKHRTTQTQIKGTQTSMPRVGFEPTIPVFGRTKTVHALDRAAGHCDLHRFEPATEKDTKARRRHRR
jgi:hypothetical protein